LILSKDARHFKIKISVPEVNKNVEGCLLKTIIS
jgi:hypothetical protein